MFYKFITVCEHDLYTVSRHPACGPPWTPLVQALQPSAMRLLLSSLSWAP